MPDNQAQKSTSPSQPATSQDHTKPDTTQKDMKPAPGTDNKTDKNSTSGSSSGSR